MTSRLRHSTSSLYNGFTDHNYLNNSEYMSVSLSDMLENSMLALDRIPEEEEHRHYKRLSSSRALRKSSGENSSITDDIRHDSLNNESFEPPPSKMNGHTDGMLTADHAEMRERVFVLEKKVAQQDDEIICLKSALADCLRKISTLENTAKANALASPSSAQNRTTLRKSNAAPIHHASTSALHNRRHTEPHSPSPSAHAPSPSSGRGNRSTAASPSPASAGRRWAAPREKEEVNGVTPTSRTPNSLRISSSIDASSRDPSYNEAALQALSLLGLKADGMAKFYLRGRPVSVYAPSNIGDYNISQKADAPAEKLKLEWVYGYRGRDCRSNVHYLPTGEVVYFIAAVVVLYNDEEQTQRHYTGHTDDVKCIAVHPDKITIATGQVAGHDKKEGKPHVRIWDSVSLATSHIIGLGEFDRGVSCLSFSKADGGHHLAVVDEANEHIISVWEWAKGEKGNKVTETKSSTEAVLCVEFHPLEKNIIVSCGRNQIAFWTFEGGCLTKKMGIFEKYDKPKFVTCVAFAENGDVMSGDSNGNLFIWSKGTNRISQAVLSAHDGGVFSICVLKDGRFVTGGKDRRIVLYENNYHRAGQEHEIPEQYGPVRMISQGKGSFLLVGTTRNNILSGTLDTKFSPIVQGHVDELWGLSTRAESSQFLSAGYDKSLKLWDVPSKSAVWSVDLPEPAHCACFHPKGTITVVGTQKAHWYAIDTDTRETVAKHLDGNEQIECCEFNKDGTMLALGSRDNFIYVYEVSDNGRKYTRVGRCSGHSSFVTHLDWSDDGQFIVSNSGDYEILFWSATTCRQVPQAATLKDVKWLTNNCTLGFNTLGIWPEGADGTDVNACARSDNEKLMASADDFGKINLYRYPTCQPKANCHTYGGHSSHVTNVKFLLNDTRLLSTGGKDFSIMQWQVV